MRITQFCFICGITAFSPFLLLFTYVFSYTSVLLFIVILKGIVLVKQGEGRVPGTKLEVMVVLMLQIVCLFIIRYITVKSYVRGKQ